MRVGGFTTAVAVTTPFEIWEYSERELTKNIVVIERASPSFSSAFTVVLDSLRFLPPNAYLKLNYYGDAGAVVNPDCDLIATASVTKNDQNFVNEAYLRDRNDNTWGNAPNTSVDPSVEHTLLTYDLGSSIRGFIRLVHATSGLIYSRIYISTDGTNYTQVINSASPNIDTKATVFAYVPYAKYVQVRVFNGSTTTYYLNDSRLRLYSLEFYSSGSTMIRGKNAVDRYMCFVNNAYYQLLEVHEL